MGHNLDCFDQIGNLQKLQNVSICINSLPEISVHFLDCSEAWFKSPRDHNTQKNHKNHQNVQKWIIFWSTWISKMNSETPNFWILKKSASQTDKIPSNHQRTRALCFWFRGSCTHGRISKNRKKFRYEQTNTSLFSSPLSPHNSVPSGQLDYTFTKVKSRRDRYFSIIDYYDNCSRSCHWLGHHFGASFLRFSTVNVQTNWSDFGTSQKF